MTLICCSLPFVGRFTQTALSFLHSRLMNSYMRILLRALRWSSQRSFDVTSLLDKWMQAGSVPALYEAVLREWEEGSKQTPAGVAKAEAYARREGGYGSLKRAAVTGVNADG